MTASAPPRLGLSIFETVQGLEEVDRRYVTCFLFLSVREVLLKSALNGVKTAGQRADAAEGRSQRESEAGSVSPGATAASSSASHAYSERSHE